MRRHVKASTARPNSSYIGRLGAAFPVFALLAFLALAVSASSAFGATVRPFAYQLTEAPAPATVTGPFTDPSGLAIDEANNIWVADVGPGLMDKFDAAGNFLAQGTGEGHWTGTYTRSISFSNAASRLYIADSNADHVWALDSSGNFVADITGEWGAGCCFIRVAADNSGGPTNGNLYVSTSHGEDTGETASVYRVDGNGNGADFSASESYIAGNRLLGTPQHEFGDPSGATAMTVDANGNLYVVDGNHNEVDEFAPTGSYIRSFTSTPQGPLGSARAVAVDPTTGNVLIADDGAHAIEEFSATGTFLRSLNGSATSSSSFGSFGDLAISATGSLYVADATNRVVHVFEPLADLADVTTGDAINISKTSAQLDGEIDPAGNGEVTGCQFKYGTTTAYGQTASCAPSPPYANQVAVSAEPVGLVPGTTYHYRLTGANADGVGTGEDRTFTTVAAVKNVTTGGASDLSPTSATLSGSLDPDGLPTTYHFDFGITTSYGQSVPAPDGDAGAGFGTVPLAAEVTGLTGHTTYHYRLVATNSSGTTFGVDRTFYAPELPEIDRLEVAPRTETTARLNGLVDPQLTSTAYYFEYGETSAYGASSPVAKDGTAGAGDEPVLVSQNISNLTPGTTYHFRLVAKNAAGTVESADMVFFTRTASEMTLPKRGIELVSAPDTGNQHVTAVETSKDGDHAVWGGFAGAPGGTTGSGNSFLATRTPTGWNSANLIPEPVDQPGGGSEHYFPFARSRDFSQGIYGVQKGVLSAPDVTVVRVGANHEQQILGTVLGVNPDVMGSSVDATTDLSHVVFWNQNEHQLFDYGTGTPVLVSAMPDGSPAACGVPEPNNGGFHTTESYDWISTTDGSRVFFGSSGNDCSQPVGLWVRNQIAQTTELISGDATLVRANPEGTTAIFRTPLAMTGEDSNSHNDLYRWVEGAGMSCLTCKFAGISVGVRAVVSTNLERIYFVSHQDLYMLDEGTLKFVASPVEEFGGTGIDPSGSQATADGKVLLFSSEGPVTTDVTGGNNEIYRYDEEDESVECISCKAAGVTDFPARGGPNGAAISEDGETIAFTTDTALLRPDVNRTTDVYLWHNGVQSQVTNGVTKWPEGAGIPRVRGISADGADIFFTVAAKLTGFEESGLANLYDSRIGGGFTPKTPPAICSEDSCQGPLLPSPPLSAPGSAGLSGPGSQRPRLHKRHQKKRHHRKHHVRHKASTRSSSKSRGGSK